MKILDFIKKYYPFIFFVAIIILSVSLFQTCSTLNHERADWKAQQRQNEQNISAMTDSIKVEFNKKLKAWEFSKDNYVVQKLGDLEKYNKDLAEQLKKVKGDIIAVIDTKVQGNLGGITTSNDLVVIDSTKNHYGLKFKSEYSDPGFQQKIVGTSKFYAIPDGITRKWKLEPDVTVLDTNLTSISITYGFKEDDKKYQVFALSKSPKITLTDMTGGYFIEKQICPTKKPKKWGVGPYFGAGLNTDFNGKNPQFGWSVGISVNYDIFQW